jgi:hypothetical protein
VGGVLGTLYNLSVGKICTYFMLYYRSCWMGSLWDREMLITITNLNIFKWMSSSKQNANIVCLRRQLFWLGLFSLKGWIRI